MADEIFQKGLGANVEDMQTLITSLSLAGPKEQKIFLDSIKNTPTEQALNMVVEFMKLPADQKATFGTPPEVKAEPKN